MNVLENSMYLGERGQRTLFSIEIVHGKDIKNHSFYKKEDEILVLPGLFFEVTGNLDSGNGLHIISFKQKRAPFTLLESPFRRRHRSRPPVSNERPPSQSVIQNPASSFLPRPPLTSKFLYDLSKTSSYFKEKAILKKSYLTIFQMLSVP